MKRAPEAVAAALRDYDEQQLRRRPVVATPVAHAAQVAAAGPRIEVDGRQYVNFCGNDYLGLANHPALAAAMSDSARRAGTGSGASHLVTGHGPEHAALEREVAEFTGREGALTFSTGYMANLGVAATLLDRRDLALGDRLNHASLVDAAQLPRGALFRRYAHGDAQAARAQLAQFALESPTAGALLLTDGVFSMDGDLAPLPELAAAAAEHRAWLAVDDAHGLGVLGRTGRGCCEVYGLGEAEVPVLIGTFGKAFGSFGAFVAGSAQLVELMIQRARTYIYTTALPQPVAAATRVALRLSDSESWRRERLHERIAQFRELALQRGLKLGPGTTPIQPVIVGDAASALQAAASLRARGFWVAAIRPPTVPAGSSRLRITLCATHAPGEVAALVDALAAAHDALPRAASPQ